MLSLFPRASNAVSEYNFWAIVKKYYLLHRSVDSQLELIYLNTIYSLLFNEGEQSSSFARNYVTKIGIHAINHFS